MTLSSPINHSTLKFWSQEAELLFISLQLLQTPKHNMSDYHKYNIFHLYHETEYKSKKFFFLLSTALLSLAVGTFSVQQSEALNMVVPSVAVPHIYRPLQLSGGAHLIYTGPLLSDLGWRRGSISCRIDLDLGFKLPDFPMKIFCRICKFCTIYECPRRFSKFRI